MLEESWLRSEISKTTTGRKMTDWDPPTKNTKLNKTGTIAQYFPPGGSYQKLWAVGTRDISDTTISSSRRSVPWRWAQGFPCGSFKVLPVALMWLEEKAAGISVVYKQAFDSLFPMARSQLSWATWCKSSISALPNFRICSSVLTQCKLPSLLP